MKKISELLRSPYFITLVIVFMYGLFTHFSNWGFSVKVLRFFHHYWWIFVSGLALLISLIRKFILKSEPKAFSILLIFFVSYLVVFQSRLVYKPTLYFILTFLFGVSLFTCIGMDGFIKLSKKLFEALRFDFIKTPFVRFIIYLLSLGIFVFVLRQNVSGLIRRYYEQHWMLIILLFPIIVVFLKRIMIDKRENYFKGIIVYFFAYVFYNLINSLLMTEVAKSIAVTLIIFISTRIYFYFDETKKIVNQLLAKLPLGEKGQITPKNLLSKLWNFIISIFAFIKTKSINLWQIVLPQINVHKNKIIILGILIIVSFITAKMVPKVIEFFRVTVVEFSPQGQVSQKTVVRVTFSDPMSTEVEDIDKLACFNIDPPLEGNYRIEGKRTIVFIPKEPLKASTIYKVNLDPQNLKFINKKRVTSGNKIKFYTELFKVSGVRTFYIYDLATNVEKKIMGEINFNYPVELEKLREKVEVICESESIDVEFEKSYLPTRFYFKTGLVHRGEKRKTIKFKVKEGLECIGGTVPLRKDFVSTISLPEKVKFQVSDIKLWHEPGNTMVTILFNMPIAKEQVESSVSVEPYVPYTIETEYCYAVLRGDFKPNIKYKITVNEGLISKAGEILEHKREKKVFIHDLSPKVKFVHSGKIVPLDGEMNIAIKTINLDKVNVNIRKMFRNNLNQFLRNEYSTQMSSTVYSGSYVVKGGRINEELVQYINLRKFHNIPYKGLFRIDISDSKSYYNRDRSWFICTDIGIIAKKSGDDLIVYTLSIKNLTPKSKTKVRLISDNNQVMDEGFTGENGKITFRNWQKNSYRFRPYFLVAEKGDDFSFLKFSSTMMNQHRFPIGGTPYSEKGMEAFLTPERGVYRPGEKAYITAIVRNKDFSVPPVLPAKLVVSDPKGAEFKKLEKKWNENGIMSFEVNFPAHALTGEYRINLFRIDKNKSLGSTSVKVEEFIPDKLKVEITSEKETIESGNLLVFFVKGKQMFGPPASGNKLMANIQFLPRIFSHPSFKGYTFCDPSRRFREEIQRLGEDFLDEMGIKKYEIEVPPLRPPSAFMAYIYTEVYDSGGRPVSAAKTISVNSYPYYIGIKVKKEPFYKTGQKIKVNFVGIDSQGKLQHIKNVQVLVKRKVWYSIFRQGSWRRSGYQSSTYEEVILQKVIDIKGKGDFSFIPDVAGEYYIYVGNEDSMRTGLRLNVVGIGYQTWGLESPEKLEIGLDKKIYNVGDTAFVDIRAPFKGKLFLTIEREKVYQTRIIELKKNKTNLLLPIKPEYLPNVYIVGMLVRTPDEMNKTLPMVSFGILPLEVNKSPKKISIKWTCKDNIESKDGIDVKVKVNSPSQKTNVILAAVDQGILQITSFRTPKPLEFFYRKNSLTTQTYSIFDMILPDIKADRLAIGGGVGEEFTRRHLNPIAAKRPKSLAHYSGILTPDENGEVRYHFKTSNFAGEVRVMALAISGSKYGSSEKNVIVADPIVVMPNFPKFIAPTDQFEIPVQIYNNTGKSGDFKTAIEVSGPVELASAREKTIFLQNKAEKKIVFLIEAKNDAGVARFRTVTQGVGKEAIHKAELSVRPFAHLESIVKMGKLKPEKSAEINVPAGFIPYGQRVRFSLSSNPLIQYLRSMDYLIKYPYGCVEQITSKLFPLIYFKELGFATGIFADKANAVDFFVQEGISKLEKMQLSDGSFTMWPGGSSYSRWLSLYVSHFLIEAQRLGYKIDPKVMSRVRSFINRLNVIRQGTGRLDRRDHNIDRRINVYALYLKALSGSPDKSSMSFLLHNKLGSLGEVDRAFLSLSYSEIGDKDTAKRILKPDFKSTFLYREQYGSFNSPIRNTAMYLLALASADPNSRKINDIIRYLGENVKNGHFGNTQENAWVFISLGKAMQSLDYDIQTQLTVDGKPYKLIKGKTEVVSDPSLGGKMIEIKNIGEKKSYYYFLAEGTPLEKHKKSQFNGIEISRTYLDEKGKKINLSNVVQGQLIIATIQVKVQKDSIHNMVIVDLLPGGFEVENPRLTSRGSLKFQPQMSMSPAYYDIRDDRLLIFADKINGAKSFSYTLRAVTPGRFTIPNIYAEAMYDPEVNGEEYEKDYLVIVPNN